MSRKWNWIVLQANDIARASTRGNSQNMTMKKNSNNMAIAIHRLLLFFSLLILHLAGCFQNDQNNIFILIATYCRSSFFREKITRLIKSYYFTWWDALKWSLSAFVFSSQFDRVEKIFPVVMGKNWRSLSLSLTHSFSKSRRQRQ